MNLIVLHSTFTIFARLIKIVMQGNIFTSAMRGGLVLGVLFSVNAARISSLVKFIYFQFINPDYLGNLYNMSMLTLEKMGLSAADGVEESLEALLQPASFALQYIWVNLLAGCFVGLVTAAFIKKEKSIFES